MNNEYFQRFVFSKDVEGGIRGDWLLPDSPSGPCSDDHENYLLILPPYSTREVLYELEELGYFATNDNGEVEMYIDLYLVSEFKNVCSNMWTGRKISNKKA